MIPEAVFPALMKSDVGDTSYLTTSLSSPSSCRNRSVSVIPVDVFICYFFFIV